MIWRACCFNRAKALEPKLASKEKSAKIPYNTSWRSKKILCDNNNIFSWDIMRFNLIINLKSRFKSLLLIYKISRTSNTEGALQSHEERVFTVTLTLKYVCPQKGLGYWVYYLKEIVNLLSFPKLIGQTIKRLAM